MSDRDTEIKLIDLEKIDTDGLNAIFSEYFIEGEVDPDGDILINRSSRVYVKADQEQQALRMYGFIQFKSNTDVESLTERIDLRNRASSIIKYSKMDKSIMAEYGIPLSGHIDHKLLIKTLEHIEREMAFIKIIVSSHSKG